MYCAIVEISYIFNSNSLRILKFAPKFDFLKFNHVINFHILHQEIHKNV